MTLTPENFEAIEWWLLTRETPETEDAELPEDFLPLKSLNEKPFLRRFWSSP